MHQTKKTAIELFALSLLSLFCELIVIRWVSADIRAFSVLKGFPLACCCIGLGAGMAMPNDRAYKISALSLLVLSVATTVLGASNLALIPFPTAAYNWETFVDVGTKGLPWIGYFALFNFVFMAALAGPFFLCLSIGSRLGELFRQMPPLQAYSINVLGALAGTLFFSCLCAFNWPPALLLFIPAIYFAATSLMAYKNLKSAVGPVLCCLLAVSAPFLVPTNGSSTVLWSPYQRLDLLTEKTATSAKYDLHANHWPYQGASDLSSMHDPLDASFRYNVPWMLKKPVGSVLILGAGMGNDVAAALRAGATHVDAVELDPVILGLGKKLHPEHPYSSSKVSAICDDARHFTATCKKQYDIIVFSHLDSHSVLSQSSSVRLDNFIYTKESMRQAAHLLKPDGLMIVSFCTHMDWFVRRLYATTSEAVGYPCAAFLDFKHGVPNTFFVVGDAVKNHTFTMPAELAAVLTPTRAELNADRVLTDDWPYLYLAPSKFDLGYFLICLIALAICLATGGRMFVTKSSARNWQLFLMGSAFLLLELQSIARLSLLFGSTWITSSIVISSVLLMILIANALIMKFPVLKSRISMAYILLLVTLVLSYVTAADPSAASHSSILGPVWVVSITCLPMFAAAWIFGASFSAASDPSAALSFNLFGSVLGALLEYSSNYLGISNMLLLASFIYLLSWIAYSRISTAIPSARTA